MILANGSRPSGITPALSICTRMANFLLFLMVEWRHARKLSSGKTTSGSYSRMKIEKSPNKGVQGTRHKVSGPLNRDVGTKEMNIRNIAAVIWALCLIGCATPPPTAPITEDKALAIVMDILRSRDAMPKDYEHTVEWATNHWSVAIQGIDYDEQGKREYMIGNHSRLVYLYPDGRLLAILNGGMATREETIQWEDNLRQLLKNEK